MKHIGEYLDVSFASQICFYLVNIEQLLSDSFSLLFGHWKASAKDSTVCLLEVYLVAHFLYSSPTHSFSLFSSLA